MARGLAALSELGGGRFALERHRGRADAARAARRRTKLAAAAATLDAALPDVFRLDHGDAAAGGRRGRRAAAGAGVRRRRCRADGAVRLSGPVKDATSQDAILSYAAALFGHDRVMRHAP